MKLRNLIALVLCLFLLLAAVGCSAGSATDSSGGMAAENNGAKEELALENESASTTLPENRKLIQTVQLRVETEDLDSVLSRIDDRLGALHGYVENSNIQNGSNYSNKRYRSATLTVRIPAEQLAAFTEHVGEVTNVVSSQKTVEDVTLSYVATESRLKALQAEEARLLEFMASADTMSDLLTVEKRLTEVRTELEKVASALRVYDNQVDYATVQLTVQEVTEYTDTSEDESVWSRIGKGFVKSLKNVGNFFKELFVFLIVALPYLVPIALVALCPIVIIRLCLRKKRKKTENKNQSFQP